MKIELSSKTISPSGAASNDLKRDLFSYCDEYYPNKSSFPHYLTSSEILSQWQQVSKNSLIQDKSKIVLIGIGGSSLGPQAVIKALSSFSTSKKEIIYLNNSDPNLFAEILSEITKESLSEYLFFFVSKSGGTVETISALSLLSTHLKSLGHKIDNSNTIACTTKGSGYLFEYAQEKDITSFFIPQEVGGRFSVFSPLGMVPFKFFDIDFPALIDGARSVLNSQEKLEKIFTLSTTLEDYRKRGITNTVLFPYSNPLEYLGKWFIQLWAESLGKDGIGFTTLNAVGATDQHSQLQLFTNGPKDKFFIFVSEEKPRYDFSFEDSEIHQPISYLKGRTIKELFQAQRVGVTKDLESKNIPFATIKVDQITEVTLGELLTTFMILTTFTGREMGINPFNQPGVERSKLYAKQEFSE